MPLTPSSIYNKVPSRNYRALRWDTWFMLILLAGKSGHKHADGRACRHMLLGVCVKELVMRVFRTSLYPQLIASTFSYGSSYWAEGMGEGSELGTVHCQYHVLPRIPIVPTHILRIHETWTCIGKQSKDNWPYSWLQRKYIEIDYLNSVILVGDTSRCF